MSKTCSRLQEAYSFQELEDMKGIELRLDRNWIWQDDGDEGPHYYFSFVVARVRSDGDYYPPKSLNTRIFDMAAYALCAQELADEYEAHEDIDVDDIVLKDILIEELFVNPACDLDDCYRTVVTIPVKYIGNKK